MDSTLTRLDRPSMKRPSTLEVSAPRASSPKVKIEKQGRRWSRLIRWIIGGAILTEAAWLVTPTVLFRTSVRATITAPLVVVRTSHEGQVLGTPPVVGSEVTAGQELFELQMAMPDHRPSERIRGEIESIRRTASSLSTQIAQMDEVKAELGKHFNDYRDARTAQAEKQAAEEAAHVNAAESRLKTAEFEVLVQKRLAAKGAASSIESARAENALVQARNDLEVARHAAARQNLQLDAARKGIFVGEADGGQDRVASKQRCDEIEIQQAGLRARLGELDGRLFELEARLASEEKYLSATRLPIVAPISGVVWSSPLVPGSEVSPNSTALEIVDPARLTIEAVFRDADAERIRPGASVKVRLFGSAQILPGHVVRVADPGAIDLETVGGGRSDFAVSRDLSGRRPVGRAARGRHSEEPRLRRRLRDRLGDSLIHSTSHKDKNEDRRTCRLTPEVNGPPPWP